MLKKIFFILTVVVAMVFITARAEAQGIGIGPQVGYHKSKDADDGNFMGGLALRFKLAPALGIEGSINYRQEELAEGALTARSWPIMVTGLLYPVPVIYGAMGAGWYSTTFDFDDSLPLVDDQTEREFGWHFGGGVELPLSGASKLTADIRYVYLNYGFEEVPGRDLDSNFYVITAGLLFGL